MQLSVTSNYRNLLACFFIAFILNESGGTNFSAQNDCNYIHLCVMKWQNMKLPIVIAAELSNKNRCAKNIDANLNKLNSKIIKVTQQSN
jgi:hypothetical protein